jgi:dihydrofolate synthase / folylpolyglutamate synthase
MAKPSYQHCLAAMYRLRRFGIKLGLETINALLNGLGNPQNDYRTIHIAGTNGKGSVAAMLSAILHQAGYRVGRYTSPHLERFNERICINDQPIDDAAVVEVYLRAAAVPDLEREPTFFELATAMALAQFSHSKVDWAIIETGMGGRLDATNAIHPDLALITNISIEHRFYLGDTIAAISAEKAGIIKPKVPVVTAVSQTRARRVILERADQLEAPAYLKGRDFRCRRQRGQRFTYYGLKQSWRNLELGLRGEHQVDNAAVALAACELLAQSKSAAISETAIRQGLLQTRWPGRLEVIPHSPEIILDGAHNLMSARILAHHLVKHYPKGNITLVVGILDDKPCQTILKDLIAPCAKVVVTQPNIDRAIPAAKLAALAKPFAPYMETVPNVAQAVQRALEISAKDDVVCVAGSLYVVGEAKTALAQLLGKNSK